MKSKAPNGAIIGSLFGIGAAMLISLGAISVFAQLLLSEKVGEGSIEMVITVILLLSSFLGSWVSAQLSPARALPASVITTAAILCMLLIAGLIAEGTFQHVWLRIGAVAAGGGISCLSCMKRGGKRIRRKKHYR